LSRVVGGMTDAHHRLGAPALIFDRLAHPDDQRAGAGAVAFSDGRAALRESVRQQLEFLLNTRVPLDIDTLEERERTTIDYGIPDLSAFPLGNNDALARLARHITRAISVYEPRLRVGDVRIEASAGQRHTLVAHVSGKFEIGAVVEPVSFVLAVGDTSRETDDS